MSMYTEEEFNKYKGAAEYLEIGYYGKAVVRKHKSYEDYIQSFKEICTEGGESVIIPRELLLYLQERIDPQNEYGVWMLINGCLGEENVFKD